VKPSPPCSLACFPAQAETTSSLRWGIFGAMLFNLRSRGGTTQYEGYIDWANQAGRMLGTQVTERTSIGCSDAGGTGLLQSIMPTQVA